MPDTPQQDPPPDEHDVPKTPPPLSYQSPVPPDEDPSDESRTVKNFAFGLIIGVVASGVGWGLVVGLSNVVVALYVFGGLFVGKIIAAGMISKSRRRPGLAAGLLVSLAVGSLVFCGTCFYAFSHI